MKKVMLVFGTRPEAIKMCPLAIGFKNNGNDFKTYVCVTGQHREMLDQVLELFGIRPDFDLDVMSKEQDLFDITLKILIGMKKVLQEVRPDIVFVHGDTTTSMAAALSAFYLQIPVAHVEAGLRTHNIYSPWPEEVNRQITSRIATYNFAPTALSRDNLLAEGIKDRSIHVVGNTVIDALHLVSGQIMSDRETGKAVEAVLSLSGIGNERLQAWGNGKRMILITGHRRENFGEGFLHICQAIRDLSLKYPDTDFVYPMHMNPNVRKPIAQIFGNRHRTEYPNVFLIEPVAYLPFVYLMNRAFFVLTDSGGIQEEAPGLGKPVLVMRDTTERPEAIDAGTARLVGTDYRNIVSGVSELLDDNVAYLRMSKAANPYGDGQSVSRIIEIMQQNL